MWCKPLPLTLFLLGMTIVSLMWPCAAKSNSAESSEEDDATRQLRRSEISRALGLLKKHSVVGKNAKIVLKASGKHLLVDPSERLQVVPKHTSSNAEQQKASPSMKANKLQESKKAKATTSNKTNNKKRASGKSSKESSTRTSKQKRRSTSATATPSSAPSPPISPLSAIQKSIMDNASSKSATIVESLMGSKMLDEVTRMVTRIVHNKPQSLPQLSDLISETLDERFGPHWHTVVVARSVQQPAGKAHNEVLAGVSMSAQDQLTALTHVAIDDHQKSNIFFVTYDFGHVLRIFIFK